ncbi:hypothetical protein G7Y29_03910 [Corynebacterium qintianiae]|uniref:Uncharacterized protein n=1 Tax=Corynebacterium qintianiae TaxID=2709392 RepID=A0A7T0KQ24_9CORY|nr:hypothetical protein [Corynebacterium qintianiae]QPK83943.1 hypothetical protein G7Y29_03910 [Corynebacterium qintianiae]
MKGPTVYPLAPSAWGAAEEIAVDNVLQPLLFSDIGNIYGTTYLSVTLEPDPLTRGWRVHARDAVIGEVAERHRGRFPSLERVHASGFTPSTLAGVRFESEQGRFAVEIFVPPADFAVPRNDAPGGAPVLPPGEMFFINTGTGEFTGEELALRSPAQWLVGLTLVGDAVVATLDGRVLGTLNDEDNHQLADLARDREVCARAHIIEGMVGLDVGDSSEESRPVPALTVPPESPRRPWDLTVFPDGTWSVTVERDSSVDPEDLAIPALGARPVSGPTTPVPSIDFTPTTSFRASSATYLTEVEKLRIRREQQGRGRHGRHRR